MRIQEMRVQEREPDRGGRTRVHTEMRAKGRTGHREGRRTGGQVRIGMRHVHGDTIMEPASTLKSKGVPQSYPSVLLDDLA